jgi:hypothetical protein
MTRLAAAERKAQITAVIDGMASAARHQRDLTAAKVAKASGVSTRLVYKHASEEFKTARASLPGSQSEDSMIVGLRRGLRDTRREVDRLRQVEAVHAACPTRDEIRRVVEMNEQLEVENRSLRAQMEHLQRARGGR